MSDSLPQWPTRLHIAGQWLESHSGASDRIVNPANGQVLAEVAVASAADVDRAVRAAREAFDRGPWPRMDPLERGRILHRIADKLRERCDDLALTDTLCVGKPIRDTLGFDIPCAADLFESYAGLADKVAGKCFGTLPDNVTLQIREPMGVVAAIVPWNFPLTNAAIKLAPILACGNTAVLKPSELAPLTALMLAEIAQEVGLPPGVLNVVNGLGGEAGQALIEHPGVDKITFTGRHTTGEKILEAAKVGMKGVMLELGGKTPSLVFPDAPLDCAVNGVLTGIFYNAGQVCVAASRLLVHESLHDDLLEQLVSKAQQLRMGDPTDPQTQLGCIAAESHLQSIERYVRQAQQEGARLALGGARATGGQVEQGCYFQPTVFDQVDASMTISKEEVFGPVLSVMTFRDEQEAIQLANQCDFGLMANIWTRDGTRALRVARQLQAGRIAVNGGGALRPGVPVFGYKLSGIGAELGFDEAVHEYTSSKAILYGLSEDPSPWPES